MTTTEIDRQLHTQVQKREAAKEKAYRDERNKYEEEFHNNLGIGGSEMTSKELRKIIDGDRRMYYRTEELNDKLYMHYKGWREIKNLDGWTGLKTIYAECNAFSYISGLHNCTKLRSLFLQDNCISHISGLETCVDLWTINLSGNFIERIEGLETLTGLNTLVIAKNKIGFGGIADVEALANTNICSLDIQDNRIDDPDVVPEVFMRMPSLRVLYLKGNGAAKKIVNYRKSLTVYCTDLRYLDDRPVFEDDRRAAEAFNRGGLEAQRAEQKLMKEEKNNKHNANMRAFQVMIEDSRQQKKERDFMRMEDKYTDDTDPVESFERRAKRLNDVWQKENKDDLKDDAKEHALKCMQSEKEGERRKAESADAEEVGDAQQASQESRETEAAEDLDAESGVIGAAEDLDVPEKKVAVDNRKLVYDDIWDTPSAGAPPSQPEKKPETRRKPAVYTDIWGDRLPDEVANKPMSPAGPPTSLGPASGGEVFMPWAQGAVGMDAVPPSQEVLEKRKAALRTKAAETADSKAAAEDEDEKAGKPTWHSKYLEQVAKTQAKCEAARSASTFKSFAPPPRTAGTSGWLEPTSTPEPTAEAASPALGAGELDEMD